MFELQSSEERLLYYCAFSQTYQFFIKQKFEAGGEYSVRGYPKKSLGPQVELEEGVLQIPGGEALLVLNQELRVQLFERFSLLGFFDAGNVWAERSDFGSDLFKSVGVGVRAFTPVGLLRLDLAVPLDRRADDPSVQVHFGFGSVF